MSILELPNGLHLDVPAEDYHARIPGLASKGVLDLVERAPSFYASWLTGVDRKATPAMAFGSALHCALLEPGVFETKYTVEPVHGDCRTPANKAARDEWRAANAGRIWLDPDDAKAIKGICAKVRAHQLAGRMLRDGAAEATVRWVDAETGLICKARADYYVASLGAVFDVKTTEDARANSFARSVDAYRYHVQQAFYSDGFASIGLPLENFIFCAVEKQPPYEVAIYDLDPEDVLDGHCAARRNILTLAECIESGSYPGYETSIQTLSRPAWARKARR